MSEMSQSHDKDLVQAVQPFRSGVAHFRASSIEHVDVYYEEPTILMTSDQHWDVVSNAVYGGGFSSASAAVNVRVPLDYASDTPAFDYVQWLQQGKLSEQHTAGFMTAAKLTHAAFCEWTDDDFALLVMATAGTSNAARAGMNRVTYAGYHAGTINVFIWIDGRMSQAAMVNAMMTATETKCSALADLQIIDKETNRIATGTTTDAMFLAASQATTYRHEHQYAGTATTLGCQLARLVYQSIYTAVATQQQD